MPARSFVTPAVLAGLFALGMACQNATAPSQRDAGNLARVLPSGPAYITGTVIARDNRFTDTRSARVAVDPQDVTGGQSADVILGADVVVVWRDGRRATPADVVLGRVVSVWVGPIVQPSRVPVADGRVLVIEQ